MIKTKERTIINDKLKQLKKDQNYADYIAIIKELLPAYNVLSCANQLDHPEFCLEGYSLLRLNEEQVCSMQYENVSICKSKNKRNVFLKHEGKGDQSKNYICMLLGYAEFSCNDSVGKENCFFAAIMDEYGTAKGSTETIQNYLAANYYFVTEIISDYNEKNYRLIIKDKGKVRRDEEKNKKVNYTCLEQVLLELYGTKVPVIYSLRRLQIHHEKYWFDLRKENIKLVSIKEHRKIHKTDSRSAHCYDPYHRKRYIDDLNEIPVPFSKIISKKKSRKQ